MPISPLSAQWLISIHAPCTGSDAATHSDRRSQSDFNPRSLHGERQDQLAVHALGREISIHAPCTGSDTDGDAQAPPRKISIHAPCTGSDDRG